MWNKKRDFIMLNNQRVQLNRNQGIGFFGILIFLILIGSVIFFGLKIFPLVNHYYTIRAVMTSVANRPDAATMSRQEIYDALSRGFEIQANFEPFNEQTASKYVFIKNPQKAGDPKTMRIVFREHVPLFQSYHILMIFDETLPLGNNAANVQ